MFHLVEEEIKLSQRSILKLLRGPDVLLPRSLCFCPKIDLPNKSPEAVFLNKKLREGAFEPGA